MPAVVAFGPERSQNWMSASGLALTSSVACLTADSAYHSKEVEAVVVVEKDQKVAFDLEQTAPVAVDVVFLVFGPVFLERYSRGRRLDRLLGGEEHLVVGPQIGPSCQR